MPFIVVFFIFISTFLEKRDLVLLVFLLVVTDLTAVEGYLKFMGTA